MSSKPAAGKSRGRLFLLLYERKCPMSEMDHTEKKQSDRWFNLFCAVMIVLLLINTFVIKLAIVDGSSMYPTLHDNQLMLVLRPGYEPTQGDVIVIHTGKSILSRDYIVKRVIATQGQNVTIDYALDTVSVDDVILSEPYLNYSEEDPMLPRDDNKVVHYTVPEGCVFVMGDNRMDSKDSRNPQIGLIDEREILGKAIFLLWPGTGSDEHPVDLDLCRIGVVVFWRT